MTFKELCIQTYSECGLQGSWPTNFSNLTGVPLKIRNWVRDADLLIQNLHLDWDFLWMSFFGDTTVGSDVAPQPSVPVGTWDIESFFINKGEDDGYPLEHMNYREWRSIVTPKEAEEPTHVCVLPSNLLRFQSTCDAVYTFWGDCWRKPVSLSEETDIPLYDVEFHRAIVAKAKMWFLEDMEALSLAQFTEKDLIDRRMGSKSEYFGLIHQMEARYLKRDHNLNLQSPEQLVVRPV